MVGTLQTSPSLVTLPERLLMASLPSDDTSQTSPSLVTLPDDVLQLIMTRLPSGDLLNLRASAHAAGGAWADEFITHLRVPLRELDLFRQPFRAHRLSHMTRLTHLELGGDKGVKTAADLADGSNGDDSNDSGGGCSISAERVLLSALLKQIRCLPSRVMASLATLVLHAVPLSCVSAVAGDLHITCPQLSNLQLDHTISDVAMQYSPAMWLEVWASLAGLPHLSHLAIRCCSVDLAGLKQVGQLSSLALVRCFDDRTTPIQLSHMTKLIELQVHMLRDDRHTMRMHGLGRLTRLQALDILLDNTFREDLWAITQQVLPQLERLTCHFTETIQSTHMQYMLWGNVALPTHLVSLHLPKLAVSVALLAALRFVTELRCKTLQLPRAVSGVVLDKLQFLSCQLIVSSLSKALVVNLDPPAPMCVSFPNLKRLDVVEMRPHFAFAGHNVADAEAWLSKVLPIQAPFLRLTDLTIVSSQARCQISTACPQLKALGLRGHDSRTIPCVEGLIKGAEELRLERPSNTYLTNVMWLASKLVKLIVEGDCDDVHFRLTDAGLAYVHGLHSRGLLPCLRHVTLRDCQSVTATGIASLAAIPSVESVLVDGCRSFTHAEAPGVLRQVGRPQLVIICQ